jgi:hypothetical protein
MKKLLFTVLFFIMLTGVSFANYPELICGDTASLVGEILADGTKTYVIKFERKKGYAGYFSVQPIFTGTGTLQIQYARSNNGTDYATAVELTAGATTDVFYEPTAGTSFFSGWIKIIFNETGSANPVVIVDPGLCRQ